MYFIKIIMPRGWRWCSNKSRITDTACQEVSSELILVVPSGSYGQHHKCFVTADTSAAIVLDAWLIPCRCSSVLVLHSMPLPLQPHSEEGKHSQHCFVVGELRYHQANSLTQGTLFED